LKSIAATVNTAPVDKSNGKNPGRRMSLRTALKATFVSFPLSLPKRERSDAQPNAHTAAHTSTAAPLTRNAARQPETFSMSALRRYDATVPAGMVDDIFTPAFARAVSVIQPAKHRITAAQSIEQKYPLTPHVMTGISPGTVKDIIMLESPAPASPVNIISCGRIFSPRNPFISCPAP
jgi:hypothetical protein